MSDIDIHRALGRIEGRLNNLDDIQRDIKSLDNRVGNLEQKAAKTGAAAGLITSVFVSVLAFSLRGVGLDN